MVCPILLPDASRKKHLKNLTLYFLLVCRTVWLKVPHVNLFISSMPIIFPRPHTLTFSAGGRFCVYFQLHASTLPPHAEFYWSCTTQLLLKINYILNMRRHWLCTTIRPKREQ
jgi:hypothetical protein